MNPEANYKKISVIIAATFLAMSILITYPFLQETASASSPTFPNDGVRLLGYPYAANRYSYRQSFPYTYDCF